MLGRYNSSSVKRIIHVFFAFLDNSWLRCLQARAVQVREEANVLHLLLKDQPGPGVEGLDWERGPCDFLEQG